MPKTPALFEGRELLTSDASECARMVEELALTTFTSRGKLVETAVKEWMASNRPGADTDRHEFHEAVVFMLRHRWDHL